MAYYPDLYPYKIDWLPNTLTPLSVGWLNKSQPYTTGSVDDFLIVKLWEFCLNPMTKFRGFHFCEFCSQAEAPILLRREEKQIQLGSTILFVLGKLNSLYVVPDLIYHYITAHNYLPPQDFLVALHESPAPEAFEYQSIRNLYVQEMRNLRAGLVKTK